MFCSKCGKTIKPDEVNCPSCGAVVGDSRFEGNGYTAAQPRYVSNESEEAARKAVPYTRTTYTTAEDEGGEGADGTDVYSRTTYRPILEDEAKQATAEPKAAKDEHVAGGQKPGQADAPVDALDVEALYRQDELQIDGSDEDVDEKIPTRAERAGRTEKHSAEPAHHKRATLPVREADPDEDPDDDIKVAPLRPIKKTGISPEVQQYMERMTQAPQGKPQKKGLKGLFGQQPAEDPSAGSGQLVGAVADAAAIEGGEDPLGVIREGGADGLDVAVNPDGTMAVRGGAPSWLKPLAIVACIAIILCVAAWALLNFFKDSTPLDGVSFDLRQQGIALIKSKADPVFRNELYKSLQADPSAATMNAKLTQAHEEIADLMPENPMKNDQLFIDSLDKIQNAIDNAAGYEAMAVLNGNAANAESLSATAQEKWGEVTNAIVRLEEAKEATEIQGIIADADAAAATPEPSAEPTTTPKPKLLKPGTNNNSNVKKLQTQLKKLGWFKGTIDSDFGPNTTQTVKKYQEAAGMARVDGVVDEETWDHIFGDQALTWKQYQANKKAEKEATQTLIPAETGEPETAPTADAQPIDNSTVEDDAAVAS